MTTSAVKPLWLCYRPRPYDANQLVQTTWEAAHALLEAYMSMEQCQTIANRRGDADRAAAFADLAHTAWRHLSDFEADVAPLMRAEGVQ